MTLDEPRRPDPDALLKEAQRAGRGRLKVFLGMSPGVGKTYEMLQQAARRKAQGADVLVGVVETHGRSETAALLDGLEVLPRKPIEYRGRTLMEFDIDAALARKPGLLLVDEYAHSNVPGSRHPKRWQDVQELVAAGVDVWTTLNVQHLESLVDVVWKITGVRQRETVPDQVLNGADDIEVIDITPAELRQRMTEGKVYVPETARLAAENFFKVENLTALRELALRRAAQTVDQQLVGAMRRAGVEGPWAAGERILVLVGADPMAAALARTGRRMADMMDASWTVAHVERPNRAPPSAHAAGQLSDALKLAEQLGGSTVALTGDDLVSTILDYAARNHVTQIVVGKPRTGRWRDLVGRSLSNALVRRASGVALHVVTEGGEAAPEAAAVPRAPVRFDWRGHAMAVVLVGVAGLIATGVDSVTSGANLAMIFLLSVLATATAYGIWPAVTAAALSAFIYNFFFLEPRLTIWIGHAADVLTFLVFFVVAMTTGWLTGRVRDQARIATQRAAAVGALLAASRRMSGAARKDEAARALAEQLAAATGGGAVVFLPADHDIVPAAGSPDMPAFSTPDMAAARWAWERGETAGAGTGTLPNAAWTFHPLQSLKARAGVAAIAPSGRGVDEERFVLALIDQGAVALERAELAADAADAEALRRTDRLRSALLNSISHDLRTPLATVLGAATTLIDYGNGMDKKVQADLLVSIREEAERLNRYVGDLLDMTRLEGGALVTRKDWIDARDVLRAALERVERRRGQRRLVTDFPRELTLIKADPGLLEQVLVNILENAIAYSPDATTIEAAAYEDRNNVVISIEDEGRGIPTTELEHVFEKFRRMEEASDRVKGTGLGLAIAKGFIEAMGGRIAAASPIANGRGTRVLISLPKDIPTPAMLL
ncbi:MAG TPA: sensor histidine kinase KdpD [Caulobacteraceae bacterium]|nr:sensor histidine kinase KdpD [Caulobacteraceae bacterium]